MIRYASAVASLILVIGSASAQQPGRKYQLQDLNKIKSIFNTTTHDNEACAIRLYYFGDTNIMLGINYKATTASVAYVDSQGRLTGEIAQYLLPTDKDSGGKFEQTQDPGESSNTFHGTDKMLKYTWASVPNDFNYNFRKEKGTTYRQILSNWRRNPGPTPVDFETQCGPEARFCECIYNYPH